MPSNQFDAIVVGGGHNGLVNAAYLARSGMKTLLLEQRHLVGGAAITEELVPGFQFTTFSYAISLLRPDIIQDLNLVEHGLMILPMAKTFKSSSSASSPNIHRSPLSCTQPTFDLFCCNIFWCRID